MSKPQRFTARSAMPASAEQLFAWHARPGAFERLMPPWEKTQVLERPRGLNVGARAVLKVPLAGPVSARFVAEHTEYVEGERFQDTQREGPFAHWVHTHRMLGQGPHASFLEDDIAFALPLGAVSRRLGQKAVVDRLRRLFAYRHTVTREDLRRHASVSEQGPQQVALTGATGMLGSTLASFLSAGGHRVRRLVRGHPFPEQGDLRWDPDKGPFPSEALEGVDAVVHLAGAPIGDKRWSPERKALILRSRKDVTRALSESLARMKQKPRVLISASAVGYYGNAGEALCSEDAPAGSDFLAEVCRDWEAATRPAEEAGIRVVHVRTGVVLTRQGGALARMLPAFRAGLGGKIGSGQQWVSWLSQEDWLGLIHFALFHPRLRGPLNAVAPQPVRQEELARTLASLLRRPSAAPLPKLAVKALFGEMGEALLLSSTRVQASRAQAEGFHFVHPSLEACLRFTLGLQTSGAEFSLPSAP